ncbi:MAG: tRNA lysidine(34) synthetase TilS [Planctomycetes bacterium]|nr:tRNA lysidine(34) synthetase TilS [Planctomycetota bacterium]MCW8135769.1 tRNA lysidine(34) synthetase TilS [Planctomycetota bacterium]
MNRFFDDVHAFIRTNDLFDRGENILVAFSGGPDSMFLASALSQISTTYRYGWDITLAHLNHGITEEADKNEEFCRNIARDRFNLPLVVRRVSIPMMLASGKYRGMNIETLGRRERYRLFVDTCREKHINKLATGHQLDDQAETVLVRAISGSWITGMGGIPVRRALSRDSKVEVVRPMLRVSRANINEWMQAEAVPYFEDPSNKDERFTRNKVRHMLMPLLATEFNPSVKSHLAALGLQAQELEHELQHIAEKFLDPPVNRGNETVVRVPIERLRVQGPLAQRYILRSALQAVGLPVREVTHRRVERVRDLLSSERRGMVVRLSDGATVMLDDTDIVLRVTHTTQLPEVITPAEFQISRDGTWVADVDRGPVARLVAEMMAMPEGGLDQLLEERPGEVEYLDAERILFPLFVRGRKDGDRIQPLGLEGEKKLQDVLVDAKVPREEREVVPLVCDSSGLLVVVGHKIAHRARVTPHTSQVMKLTAIPRTGGSEGSGFLPPIT